MILLSVLAPFCSLVFNLEYKSQTHSTAMSSSSSDGTDQVSSKAQPIDQQDGEVTIDDCNSENDEVPHLFAHHPPPPDGGWAAWLQIILGHLVMFNTWGMANSFGIFEEYYSKTLLKSNTAAQISLIGSLELFFLFAVGVVAGRATDEGYFRVVFVSGIILQLIGLFLTSLCTKYWQIFLAQAVCQGIGSGCTYTPALVIISQYFVRNRAFAIAIAASGTATGGLVYPAVANTMITNSKYGFPWTMRVMGFIALAAYAPCAVFLKPRVPKRDSGSLIEWSAFKEPAFSFFTFGLFFIFWGIYCTFFYLGTFAQQIIGVSKPFNLIMVLNGVGLIGRIVPSILSDRWFGMLNVLIVVSFGSTVIMFCWAAVSSVAGLYVFAAVYGLVVAGVQALFSASATTMTPDIRKTGTRLGMIVSIIGLATLTGPSIQGALISNDSGRYLYAQLFAGLSMAVGLCLLVIARVSKTGWILRARA